MSRRNWSACLAAMLTIAAAAGTLATASAADVGTTWSPGPQTTIITTTEPPGKCSFKYTLLSAWSTGYLAQVTVINNDAPVDGWVIDWHFADGQRLVNGWGGVFSSPDGAHISIRDAGWNSSVPTGGAVTVGFTATFSGSHPPPLGRTFNGNYCTWVG